MIGRVLLVLGASGLVYACARDQAKQELRHEAGLERRVMVLEQHVRVLEQVRIQPKAPAPGSNAAAP